MDDDRRRFCQVMGAAVVGAALPSVGCGGKMEMTGPHIFTTTFKAADIKMNDFAFATGPGVNVNICRDSGGLFAEDADCTHAQCLLEFDNTTNPNAPQWQCNCHGSKFDFVGNVLNPPAVKTLVHYKLTVNSDGSCTFDLAQIVDPSTRTMG
jgi:nitrite reductase/ring-hydroxylating ferredoxin subunit